MMASAEAAEGQTVKIPVAQGASVVTALGVNSGETLTSGSVLTWVNGRPVIALRGPFPLYRDLKEGDKGADVTMIQQALRDLGYDILPGSDFGPYTAACLRDLYKSVGATMLETSGQPQEAQAEAGNTSSAGGSSNKSEGNAGGQGTSGQPRKVASLPMSEIAIVPTLPASVSDVPSVGTSLEGDNAVVKLAGAKVNLKAAVTGAVAARLKSGMPASARVDGTDIALTIDTITQPSAPQNSGAAGQAPQSAAGDAAGASATTGASNSPTVFFKPTSGEVPTAWIGRSDILITLNLTDPIRDTLLVPQSALATNAAGQTNMLVQDSSGQFTLTPVKQIACIKGTCAIESNSVKAGAKVQVDR